RRLDLLGQGIQVVVDGSGHADGVYSQSISAPRKRVGQVFYFLEVGARDRRNHDCIHTGLDRSFDHNLSVGTEFACIKMAVRVDEHKALVGSFGLLSPAHSRTGAASVSTSEPSSMNNWRSASMARAGS